MSGGGGSSSSFGRSSNIGESLLGDGTNLGGVSGNEPNCKDVNITTLVTSSKSASRLLQVGDKLKVSIFNKNGTKALALHDNNGNLIGGLDSQSQIIIGCIEDGYEYTATIIDKTIAKIQVQISISPYGNFKWTL